MVPCHGLVARAVLPRPRGLRGPITCGEGGLVSTFVQLACLWSGTVGGWNPPGGYVEWVDGRSGVLRLCRDPAPWLPPPSCSVSSVRALQERPPHAKRLAGCGSRLAGYHLPAAAQPQLQRGDCRQSNGFAVCEASWRADSLLADERGTWWCVPIRLVGMRWVREEGGGGVLGGGGWSVEERQEGVVESLHLREIHKRNVQHVFISSVVNEGVQ